jgi:hypothetical protein
MKQTLSLTPSTDALGFDAWFGGTPLIVTGTVPADPVMTTWMMQLWKYPSDAYETDAEPLLNAVGSVASSTVTVAFTATQLATLELSQVAGSNNYWLTIGGLDANGSGRMIRGGTIEIIPGPFVSDASTELTQITIEDDIASFVFNGVTYTVPVAAVETPTGAVEGAIVVIDDVAILTVDGVSYTFPVSEES